MTMNPFRAVWCLACVGGLALAAACSGDDFSGSSGGADGGGAGGSAGSTSGGSAGSTAGTAGSAGSGGTGGSTGGSGGTGATGGAGGSGGSTPCTDGQCADDEYCHSDGSCRKCTDIDEMEFAPPEPLAGVNNVLTVDTQWPRPIESGEMIYVAGAGYHTRKLWFTPDFMQGPGAQLPAPLDAIETDGGDLVESGPLLTLPAAEGPLKDFALFFDRSTDAGLVPGRKLWGAKYDGTKQEFLPPQELPAPFNAVNASWDMAVAPGAQRAWFMSNRDNVLEPKLYTASSATSGPPTAEPVSLVTLPNNCPVSEWELAPWVTLDGLLLFFHARETGSGCVKGQTTDIFVIVLAPSGQAAGISAYPLPLNLPNTNDTTPAMSFDMCSLYFSSDREVPKRQRLYRARRK